ncbi:sensor histidine kinase [Filimonas lacunae]|nr:HAMP domain-containing sensor histidine kinase [Filimonas lacunae]
MTIYFLLTRQTNFALHIILYMVAFCATLLLLIIKHRSKYWSHAALILQTGIIWVLLLMPLQNTQLITLQFALLVILCSFYVLGKTWGFIYSFCCAMPLSWHLWTQANGGLLLWGGYQTKGLVIGMVLLVNFVFIIFAHYHFFNAFTQTIEELNNRTLLLNETVKELELSRDELRQQSRLQKKLIAAITHDIKSPLKYLMLTGKNLYRNSRNQNGNLEESIRAIYASSFQMYHFTNNLLQYAALYLEDNRIVTSVFNLDDLVKEKISIFTEMIASQNNTVVNNIDPNLMVCTNKELLSVIIHNLLDNAIKYTVNGRILFSANHHRGKLQVCVQDSGAGMAPELVNWCNNRLAVKDFMSENGGQGLGLAMVKELIGLIKGNIMVQSKKDSGTVILLLLPSCI